jgi:hypothetical protein
MKQNTKVTITIAALVMATSAAADDSHFEITPFGAYRFGGTINIENSSDSYEIADAQSFGLILNLREQENTQWEVLYSRQDSDADLSTAMPGDPNVNIVIQVLQLGGTYQGGGEKVRPYLAATMGGTHIEATAGGTGKDTFLSGSIGVGMQISPYSRLGLRVEARVYGTLMSSKTDLFCQTGPDANVCAVRIDGKLLSQFETFAGVVFRF